mmetsp:Transcript_21168/g.44010  ORF Transcript_21168/g.44010 Transcript_21168/m.44010 type:complete len:458 (+) Transcript_21168:61-1434(+)
MKFLRTSSTMNTARSLYIIISLLASTVSLQSDAADAEAASDAAINPTGEDAFSSMSLAERLSVKFTSVYQSTPHTVILSSYFPTEELHCEFEAWMEKFERLYESAEAMAWRKLIWLENHSHIFFHNSQTPKSSYTLGHNDFSDMTNEEFRKRFYLGEFSPGVIKSRNGVIGGFDANVFASERKLRGDSETVMDWNGEQLLFVKDEVKEDEDDSATVVDVPDSKNWVDEGAVTSVKNQLMCGACWAFSAIGAIEGARYIATGNLTDLSMQQLIDCDLTDLGCSGGLMDQAFQYDEDNVGICSLAEYPFAMHRHWFFGCRRYMPYCEPLPYTKVKQFVDVDKTEEALKAAVATQPVSIAVVAGDVNWQFYSGGVYDAGCDDELDHGILAVGYGHYDPGTNPNNSNSTAVPMDYWLAKNSWGASWGMNGYIQLARNIGNEAEGGSSCILQLASRPVLKEE